MNKMFNFNGMPYKRSGRAGGKSVSMIGMLVLLLAALLVLPSCDDTETVEGPETIICNGVEVADRNAPECQAAEEDDDYLEATGGTADRYSMGSDFDDMLAGDDEADYIDGGLGDDSIKGMGGDDSLKGDGGNDTLYGGDGDDVLDGGTGNDTIDGGAGDDELTGGSGNNTLDGGAGDDDIVIFLGALGVRVELDNDRARVQHAQAKPGEPLSFEDDADSGEGTDTLMNIENVKGTHYSDRIDGDEKANLLKGLDGADTINGLGGDDIIIPNRPMVVEGEAPDDGVDVVDGGADDDTISYEGEAADRDVTIDLSTVVPEVEEVEADDQGQNAMEGVIAHVAAAVTNPPVIDMIKVIVVVDEDTEDESKVSTIEHITGGAGDDDLTGDARANTLKGLGGGDTLRGGAGNDMLMGGEGIDMLHGGAGNDTLNGGAGADMLNGNAGDDTYVEVGVGTGVTDDVMEAENEGTDEVHYTALADNEGTPDMDESEAGVTVSPTPRNVEVVAGTQNDDTITANVDGATILGLEGDDTLAGGEGADTLVGCAGDNTLTGNGGNDIFGVFNDDDDDTFDTITDFTTGEGMATTDEIHLKGWDAGTVTVDLVPGNSTHAGVLVDGVLVAIVTSIAIEEVAATDDDPPVAAKTKVEAIIEALKKSNAGAAVVRLVDPPFPVEKCASPSSN